VLLNLTVGSRDGLPLILNSGQIASLPEQWLTREISGTI